MIGADFARMMAGYNAEMNRRWYAAASRLSDEQRKEDIGLFWHSIVGTLNHLLWADQMWMSRLADWDRPDVPLAKSDSLIADFAALSAAREAADLAIIVWTDVLGDDAFPGDLTWFSGVSKREITKPRALLVMHMFNHQTHHRGQIHAGLTKFGADPGVTDLPFMGKSSS